MIGKEIVFNINKIEHKGIILDKIRVLASREVRSIGVLSGSKIIDGSIDNYLVRLTNQAIVSVDCDKIIQVNK